MKQKIKDNLELMTIAFIVLTCLAIMLYIIATFPSDKSDMKLCEHKHSRSVCEHLIYGN